MKKVLLGLFLSIAFASFNANAAVVIFTDRMAWEAAAGSFSEENFNSYTNGVSYEFSPIDVGDFTVSVSGSTYGSSWHFIGPAFNANDVNGTGQLNIATGDLGGTNLAFDKLITGFGANWSGVSNDRTTSIIIGNEVIDLPNINGGFFGFISDVAFTSVDFVLTSGAADGFAIDNVVYSPVPLPAAAWLFGSGLLGLVGMSRRKKSMA